MSLQTESVMVYVCLLLTMFKTAFFVQKASFERIDYSYLIPYLEYSAYVSALLVLMGFIQQKRLKNFQV